ncbi:MAG TPA: helix-turn-helix domain-containing protein [Kofleriaceae bacterium]|nr:helix-turn-helix domain-containing protein [Kofleriaceae bacterium]
MKLDARQAARMLGLTETEIYRRVGAGEIPFTMIHHRPLFHRIELFEWAMSIELPVTADLYDLYDHLHEDREPHPLADALARGKGGTISADLAEIAEAIPARSRSERELIGAMIAARSPAMFVSRAADRIALPRACSPIICADTPGLVLLWWAAHHALTLPDVPVHALFLIVAPTIRRHHELLARLALALHDPALRAAVQRAGAFADVVSEARRWELSLAAARASGATP